MLVEDSMIWLRIASRAAARLSGCLKVKVGSVIVKDGKVVSVGVNKTDMNLCKTKGCLRIAVYGNDSKNHRLPSDCRAIHSEVDAICKAGQNLTGATIYVTRYPCESCARAIAASGITTVVYGREQEISYNTRKIFGGNNIKVFHLSEFKEEDVNT